MSQNSPATALTEVALFPIPDAVAFPGTVMPLHVFEPRYRQMIHDCVRDDRMVGVTDVLKTIHQPPVNQSLEQALNSNQATYKPKEVFSAGHCEIVETTDDGRIVAAITMSKRLQLVAEVQSLPYRIVSCAQLSDVGPEAQAEYEDVASNSAALKQSINRRLIELVGEQNQALIKALQDPAWTSLEPGEYSFQIFQYLRFDAGAMQKILEARSANARLEMIWEILRQN
jgi:Lon protease-like protein